MDLDLNVEMPSAQALASQAPTTSTSIQPTAKMKVMVPAVGRLDTIEKKRRLDAALGVNQAEYWSAVLQYLSSKISRIEFYEIVISTLGVDNMRLHNDFFCAILYNANSTELPPSKKQPQAAGSSPSMSPMVEETPLMAAKASPSPILNGELPPLTPTPAMPTLAINPAALPPNSVQAKAAAKPSKKKKVEPILNPFTQRLAVSQFEQPLSNVSLSELPHVPMQHIGVPGMHRDYLRNEDSTASNDCVRIRDTIHRHAREAGIKTVSDDAVSALVFGLEQHLRKILDQTVKSAISDRSRRSQDDSAVRESKGGSIGLQNLLAAVVNNPGLVGDELPLIRERIMLHLY